MSKFEQLVLFSYLDERESQTRLVTAEAFSLPKRRRRKQAGFLLTMKIAAAGLIKTTCTKAFVKLRTVKLIELEQMDLFTYLDQSETLITKVPSFFERLCDKQTPLLDSKKRAAVRGIKTFQERGVSKLQKPIFHLAKSQLKILSLQAVKRKQQGAAVFRSGAKKVIIHLKREYAEFKMGLRDLRLSSEAQPEHPHSAPIGLFAALKTFFGLAPWINVYKVTRAYGGSEHGGWYYRKYSCEKSVQVWRWNAEAAVAKNLRTYEKLSWGLLCFEAAGTEIAVNIEWKAAQLQVKTKPAYHPNIVVKSILDSDQKVTLGGLLPATFKPIYANSAHTRPASPKVMGKLLQFVRTAREEDEVCERCKGTGRTIYTHIQNGRCFLCGGAGKKEDQPGDADKTVNFSL